MSAPTPTESPKHQDPANGLAVPWYSPRRIRFWVVAAVLAYTLAGFFLAPLLVKKLAVDGVRDATGRELAIGKVRVNPFVLSTDVEAIALRDPDGAVLFALDHFHANFQLSSVFRWAWTFRDLRFEGPYFLYERFAPGDDRLARLLADVERLAPADTPPPEPEAGLPRLLITHLTVSGGRAELRDDVPAEAVRLEIGPVNVSVHELNTLPDRDGRQNVEIRFAEDAVIRWQGSLALAPLNSEGRLELDDVPIDPVRAYLDPHIELEQLAARLSLRTDYRLASRDDGELSVALTEIETDLEELSVTGFDPAESLLAVTAVRTRGGALDWPEARLAIGTIDVDGLETALQLDASGQPRLLQLLPPADTENTAPATDAATTWKIGAERLAIGGARIALEDRSVTPAATLTVSALDAALTGIDTAAGTVMPLTVGVRLDGGGAVDVSGDLAVLPALTFDGQARVDGLPLRLAQPYVAQVLAVAVEGGALGAELELALTDTGTLRAAGSARVDGLEVNDTIENQPLLAWQRLAIDRFEADTGTRRAEVSRIELSEPFGRVQVRADRSTNLAGLVVDAGDTPAETPPQGEDAPPWSATVGKIDFDGGGMDFSDLSLPLPFAVRIAELDGSIGGIASGSAEPAAVQLEGKVGDYGLSRIGGEINLFDPLARTDITMEFRNLLMSDLSPYSIEFAGRHIDEGKLDLDLEYVIEDSRLAGRNDIVVSDLLLGEAVESPNAVSLPLDLAVALLKDANGVIDVELPVEGDVDDPEFRIGGVIWKAFTSLITKIVTAPFALLGNLVGGGEDLGQFEFLAGRADLTPPEQEKVLQLGEALQQRPQLAIAVAGVYDPAVDAPVLRYVRLRDTVYARLGKPAAEGDGDRSEMLTEEVRGVLEELFGERFPAEDPAALRERHTVPPADDPEGEPRLDELAYAAELRDRLLASEEIGPDELRELAQARAEAVRAAFMAAGALGEERIRLAEPVAVDSDGGEWVAMALEVAVD